MLRPLAISSLVLLAACAAGPEPAQEAPETPSRAPQAGHIDPVTGEPLGAYHVTGVAVDPRDADGRIHVGLVADSGSQTQGGSPGAFALKAWTNDPLNLCAWTSDGRIVVEPNVEPGSTGHHLEPTEQGGFVTVEMTGRGALRVGVDHDGTRVHDVTVRDGKPTRLVVPAGDVTLIAYHWEDGERHQWGRQVSNVEPLEELTWTLTASEQLR